MKKMMLLAMIALFGAGIVCAAITAKDLSPKAIRTASAALPKNQRQNYARQILEAVAAQPIDEVTKTKELTSAARALIAGARSGGAIAVIAEIFNTIPIANLQAVADLLATNNFGQKLNGMTDEQFNTFGIKVIKSASDYIIATGTDSPTLRISILVAAFTKASANQEITRSTLIAALPESMQAAAATYVLASEQNNTNVIAAAAGVDSVEATPDDPDADKIVKTEEQTVETSTSANDEVTDNSAASDGANNGDDTPPSANVESGDVDATGDGVATTSDEGAVVPANDDMVAPSEASIQVTSEDPVATDGDAQVPLLARMSSDTLGLTIDSMHVAVYEWDTIDAENRINDPIIGTLPGIGPTYTVPGNSTPNTPTTPPPLLPPSPAYGNQRTF